MTKRAWKNAVYRAIQRVAWRQSVLTTDDVWIELGSLDYQGDKRILGSVMREAEHYEVIRKVYGAAALTARPSRHRGIATVWASRLYREETP